MKYDSDEALAEELTRIGRLLSPRPDGLRAVLKGGVPVRSPLLFTFNSYMSTYTKLGATLVAIIVIAGGVYGLSGPAEQGTVALQTETVANDTAAAKSMAATAPDVPPADDSFDSFAAAMQADIAAQEAAVQSLDQSTDSSVSSANTVTSSNEPYDPSSI